MNNNMPREIGIDSTINLLKDGYQFIMDRSDRFNSPVFETRLLGQKAICMIGEEAAELFYDEEKFQREGAAPNRVQETLFGKGGVQGLDGSAHKHRKEMFMRIMSKENLGKLNEIVTEQWEDAIARWEEKEEIIFYTEVQEVLAISACRWAGIPVEDGEIDKLTNQLASLFESAASVGPPHWVGRNARNQLEKWMEGLVNDVRSEKLHPPVNSALHQFSLQKDLEGNFLEADIVAVEVLNIIRPIVAVSVYINFLFLALYDHPEEKQKLKAADDNYKQQFIQEVRRFYPFFPFVTALVKTDFIWNDFKFKEGTMTLLDLYGTNHHPDSWDKPDVFQPERFADWKGSPFAFIPQGGGEHYLGHRCAGEWVTLEIMKISLDFLVNHLEYEVPNQDLSLSRNDIPSVPESKIVLSNVRRKLI